MFEEIKSKMSGLKDKSEELIMSKLDIIMTKIPNAASTAGTKLQDFWNNEEQLRYVFALVHESMPLPFRLAISEEKFVEFCIQHKEKIQQAFAKHQNHDKSNGQQPTQTDTEVEKEDANTPIEKR